MRKILNIIIITSLLFFLASGIFLKPEKNDYKFNEVSTVAAMDNLLAGDNLLLIDFYADWCGPCLMLDPSLAELDKKNKKDVDLIKVNVDESAALAAQFQINKLPTLFLIKGKKVIAKTNEVLKYEDLLKFIQLKDP